MEIIIRQYKDPFINQISISWFMECQGFVSRCSNDYPSRSNPTPPPICKICSSKLDTFTLGRGENHPPEMYRMFFFFFGGYVILADGNQKSGLSPGLYGKYAHLFTTGFLHHPKGGWELGFLNSSFPRMDFSHVRALKHNGSPTYPPPSPRPNVLRLRNTGL